MVVQSKQQTSISISIYAVIENYRRDLDKYYCQHLIILLVDLLIETAALKVYKKRGRKRERKRKEDICACKKRLKSENEWGERRIVVKKRERKKENDYR